jgi:hypothetical protein
MRTKEEIAAYQKQWRAKNKSKIKEYMMEYYKTYEPSFERTLLAQLRNRAKKFDISFDLNESDIVVPELCPILGIKLSRNVGQMGPHPASPSVDRIIPSKGYTKGNIQIISLKANVMKNDATPEELRRFAEWVLKTFPP